MVGLVQVLYRLGKKVIVVMCELFFGLVMGIKGGVVGGGYV